MSESPASPVSAPAASSASVQEAQMVTVLLQPEEKTVKLPRDKVKNVQRLLAVLGIRPCTALVARGRELLTPDRQILSGDHLLVRKVTSSG